MQDQHLGLMSKSFMARAFARCDISIWYRDKISVLKSLHLRSTTQGTIIYLHIFDIRKEHFFIYGYEWSAVHYFLLFLADRFQFHFHANYC